jgi:hypothetical protein
MANTKINQLPLFTGNTSGTYLVMNNSGETSTYKVTKETLLGSINTVSTGSTNSLAYYQTTGSIIGNNVAQLVNNAATLALGTSAFNNSEPERLMVDGGTSYNIATFQTSQQNSYAEVNIKNFGSGSNASTDLVLWNDVGTESSSYFDIGINSSTYSGGLGYAGDAYIYNSDNDLYVGSNGTNNHGHLHLFSGAHIGKPAISMYADRTIAFNISNQISGSQTTTVPTSGFTYEFSGSMKLNNNIKVEGSITNNSYVVLSQVSGSLDFLNDAAAATGGVPLGGLYRNGNFVMIRIT